MGQSKAGGGGILKKSGVGAVRSSFIRSCSFFLVNGGKGKAATLPVIVDICLCVMVFFFLFSII